MRFLSLFSPVASELCALSSGERLALVSFVLFSVVFTVLFCASVS